MAESLTVLQAILLGVLQGLTEWLPVSSSGHLVLAQEVLGVEAPVFFDLVLHLGTLLVVLVYFRSTIAEVLVSLWTAPRARRERGSWRAAVWDDPPRRLAVLVVAGSVPTAIIGLTLEDFFVAQFENGMTAAVMLLVTGTFVWLTKYAPAPRPVAGMGWRDALLVGTAQGLAIMPGISRSGATISAAAFLGVDRETAVRYSFLLAIPAIGGAFLLRVDPAALADVAASPLAYAAGTGAAIVVGYLSLAFLVIITRRKGFHWFAPYCWALGAAALAWFTLGAR